MEFAQVVSGFAVGAIVGITGVGGGSLMTPLLVLLFGIAPATAVGTDLLYAAITKSGGTLVHARRGNVDWRVVRLLATLAPGGGHGFAGSANFSTVELFAYPTPR
jgi:uncharacterized membrane protein YfcA